MTKSTKGKTKKKMNSKFLNEDGKQISKIDNKNAEKEVDWDNVDDLLKIGCIGEEIAAVLNLDYDTISRHCEKENGISFADYVEKKHNGDYHISLRRGQFRAAMGEPKYKNVNGKKVFDGWHRKPDTALLIFLGKNELGQSDRQDHQIQVQQKLIDFVPKNEDERKLLERMFERRQELLSEGISEDESYDVSSGGNGG